MPLNTRDSSARRGDSRHLGRRRWQADHRNDVDKAYRRTRDTSQTLSDEETLTAKLTLLNDLIVQDILLAKAAAAEARRCRRASSTPPTPTRRRTSPTTPFSRS